MHYSHILAGLPPLLLILLLLSQSQASPTLPWMTPQTAAHYQVKVLSTPNQPIVATINWTVQSLTSQNITISEDYILTQTGALVVSLFTGGAVTLLGARVISQVEYNLTDGLCLRPCLLLRVPNHHAWEWIPSNQTAALRGGLFNILRSTFEVLGNQTLTPYNRTAWRLRPLTQEYLPAILGNFWYDQHTGILLQADISSPTDGNLTVTLASSSSNLALQELPLAFPPLQVPLTFFTIAGLFTLLLPKMRARPRRDS